MLLEGSIVGIGTASNCVNKIGIFEVTLRLWYLKYYYDSLALYLVGVSLDTL